MDIPEDSADYKNLIYEHMAYSARSELALFLPRAYYVYLLFSCGDFLQTVGPRLGLTEWRSDIN